MKKRYTRGKLNPLACKQGRPTPPQMSIRKKSFVSFPSAL